MSFIQPTEQKGRIIFDNAVVFMPDSRILEKIGVLGQFPACPLILNRDEFSKQSLEAVIAYNMANRLAVFSDLLNDRWVRSVENFTTLHMYDAEKSKHRAFDGCNDISAVILKYAGRLNLGEAALADVDAHMPGYSEAYKNKNLAAILRTAKASYIEKIGQENL